MATPASSTVLKAFRLLDLFTEEPVLGVGEAARMLGAPRASTHRLLVSLKQAGVVESTAQGQYRLALRMFELGSVVPVRRWLHEGSTVALERIAAELRLTVHLAVRDENETVYLDKVQHPSVRVPTRIGNREALHHTAVGRALLAHAPIRVIEAYLDGPLDPATRNSIVSPMRLLRELDETRRRGIACDREESIIGLVRMATTVRNHTGKVLAGIEVVAPAATPTLRFKQLEPPLRRAAALIERQLGLLETFEPAANEPAIAAAG